MKKVVRQNFSFLTWSVAACLALCMAACGDDDEAGANAGEGGPLQPQIATLTISDGRVITYPYASVWYDDEAPDGPTCSFDFTSIPYAETEEETGRWDDFMIDMCVTAAHAIPTGVIPYGSPDGSVKPCWFDCEAADYDYTGGNNGDGEYFYNDESPQGSNTSMIITKKDGGYRVEIRDLKLWSRASASVSGHGSTLTATFVFEGTFAPLN